MNYRVIYQCKASKQVIPEVLSIMKFRKCRFYVRINSVSEPRNNHGVDYYMILLHVGWGGGSNGVVQKTNSCNLLKVVYHMFSCKNL